MKAEHLAVIDEKGEEVNIDDLTFEGCYSLKVQCFKLTQELNRRMQEESVKQYG